MPIRVVLPALPVLGHPEQKMVAPLWSWQRRTDHSRLGQQGSDQVAPGQKPSPPLYSLFGDLQNIMVRATGHDPEAVCRCPCADEDTDMASR